MRHYSSVPQVKTAPDAVLTSLFGTDSPDWSFGALSATWRVAHGDPARFPEALRAPMLSDITALCRSYRGGACITSGPKSPEMVPVSKANANVLRQMGLTVYLHDLALCVPGLDALLRQIESEAGIKTGSARCGAFLSPPGDGLACHYDADDVISIQLSGRKRFHLAPVTELPNPHGMQYGPGMIPYDDLYPQVRGRFPDWRDAQFETVEMAPGSVLFMPRGIWHRSEAITESLAVSIILRPPLLLEGALEQLRLLLLQDARWRQPLYGMAGADAGAAIAPLLDDLPRISAAVRAEDIVSRQHSEDERRAAIATQSRFQTNPVARLDVVSDGRSGVRTLLLKTVDDQHGERLTARLQLAPAAVTVFEWLAAQQGPFRAQDVVAHFPAFPPDEHLAILRTAVQGQLLKLLGYAELSAGL